MAARGGGAALAARGGAAVLPACGGPGSGGDGARGSARDTPGRRRRPGNSAARPGSRLAAVRPVRACFAPSWVAH